MKKTRFRLLGAYEERSTYSSADFLRTVYKRFKRKGITVECVQIDNSFEFTNRFANSKRDLKTLFEATASELGIRHKLIRPENLRVFRAAKGAGADFCKICALSPHMSLK